MNEETARILHNTITTVCCTILAIAFHKWGLIFLAALFWCFRKD